MLIYFKPLRRKFGVVALGLASLFAAGWLRSLESVDAIQLNLSTSNVVLVSGSEGLLILRNTQFSWSHCGDAPFVWQYADGATLVLSAHRYERSSILYNHQTWSARNLGIFSSFHDAVVLNQWPLSMIPYRLIVIPLTLLSAWLLLSKPRVREVPENHR